MQEKKERGREEEPAASLLPLCPAGSPNFSGSDFNVS